MKLIHVIECINGNIQPPKSFAANDGEEEEYRKIKEEAVEEFKDLMSQNWDGDPSEESIEECVKKEHFSNGPYDLWILYSEINN